MDDSNSRRIPWALFVSELIGTALLVLIGLSLVILMFGTLLQLALLKSPEPKQVQDHFNRYQGE